MGSNLPATDTDSARSRVTVGPASEWTVMRAVDDKWKAPGGAAYSLIHSDEQVHAESRERFIHHVRRLETLAAVHDAAQWKTDFDPTTQRIVLHTLAVRRGDTIINHVNPEKFRFLQRESSLESLMLFGVVSLLVVLDDVRVGDILETSLTICNEPRIYAEHCFELDWPSQSIPVRAWHRSVRFTSPRPMRWKSSGNDMAPAISEASPGVTEWHWKLENLKPQEFEPFTPEWTLPPQWLQFSDFASWGEVAACSLAKWDEGFDHEELRRMVAEIAAQAPTLLERVGLALTMVQDDIRYLSVNLELGGQIPSPPGLVIQRRFGDCKDKSFLLAHLFRCLGVPARPILVHTSLRKTIAELLPAPEFTHAVVEYELDGVRYWADSTIALQGGDAKSRYTSHFIYGLPVAPGVEALEEQPSLIPPGKLVLHEQFALDERMHRSRVAIFYTATGAEADHLRAELLMHGTEKFGENRAHYYRRFFPKAKVIRQPEWQDDRKRNRLKCGLVLELPQTGALSPDGALSAFSYCGHLIRGCMPVPDKGHRFMPVQIAKGTKHEHIIEMLNTKLQTEMDTTVIVRHGTFEFRSVCGNRAKGYVMHFNISVLKDVVRPGNLANFRARMSEVWVATEVGLIISSGKFFGLGLRASDPLVPVARPLALPNQTVPEPATLPAEPVPPLAPLPTAPQAALTGTVQAQSEKPTPTVTIDRFPQPMPLEGRSRSRGERGDRRRDSSQSSGTTRRNRRRRRRKILLFVLLFVLIAAVAVTAMLMLRN